MKTAIVMKSDLSIASIYDGAPDQGRFGGPWGWPDASAHVEMPDGFASDEVDVLDDGEGNITIVASDAGKRKANKKALDAYKVQREAQADVVIRGILDAAFGEGVAETTCLMLATGAMDVAMNITGDKTQEEVDGAKAVLVGYRQAMADIQVERAARDAEIAAFAPPHVVDPLY